MLERLFSLSSPDDALFAERVYLRLPEMRDYEAWARLRRQSRAFLVPWEPTWAPDDLARSTFRRRVKRQQQHLRNDLNYGYLIFRIGDDQIVGGVTLSNVRRGVAQTASVGYWLGEPFTGRGYMTEALNRLVEQCFGPMQLNRLEAACLPNNAASIALLQRTGFTREGYSRKYLKINGGWCDHLLFAKLADD